PKVITGNLTINGGSTLTLTGTIYVQGTVTFGNNSTLALSSGYGAQSGILLSDGWVDVSNNASFSGSGQAGSYVLVDSQSNCMGISSASCSNSSHSAINITNNTNGAIFYAPNGLISVSNNVS